jgi:hypothetical protein
MGGVRVVFLRLNDHEWWAEGMSICHIHLYGSDNLILPVSAHLTRRNLRLTTHWMYLKLATILSFFAILGEFKTDNNPELVSEQKPDLNKLRDEHSDWIDFARSEAAQKGVGCPSGLQ